MDRGSEGWRVQYNLAQGVDATRFIVSAQPSLTEEKLLYIVQLWKKHDNNSSNFVALNTCVI